MLRRVGRSNTQAVVLQNEDGLAIVVAQVGVVGDTVFGTKTGRHGENDNWHEGAASSAFAWPLRHSTYESS